MAGSVRVGLGRLGALGAALAALLACSSTTLQSSYLDKSYTGGPRQKVLVVGLAPQEGARRQFENAFAMGILDAGAVGVASSDIWTDLGELDRERVASWVRDHGFDGVLVTHVVRLEKQTEYVPPSYSYDLYGYWGYRWGGVGPGGMVSPGYAIEREYLHLETNLYDPATGKLVWSGHSRSFDPSERDRVIDDTVEVLVSELQEQNLLPST